MPATSAARMALLALALLAACGTQQEQCIRSNTRELRTVERLIAEVQANIARGYAVETYEVPTVEWVLCPPLYPAQPGQPAPPPRMCPERDYEVRERNVPIDPQAEARKLEGLKARRAALLRQAEAAIAACKAQYPETN